MSDAAVSRPMKFEPTLVALAATLDDEAFEIETSLLRLQFAADDLLDEKAALKLSTKNIRAPKDEELSEMRDKVEAIHQINVKNRKAKVIIAAVEDVAGDLPALG